MDDSALHPFMNSISRAFRLREQLISSLLEGNEKMADEFSFEYGQAVEEILKHQVKSLTELEQKIDFFFDCIFQDCDDEQIFHKCRNSLFQDISVLKTT